MSDPKEHLLAALRREASDGHEEPEAARPTRVDSTLSLMHDVLEGKAPLADGLKAIESYRERLKKAQETIESQMPELKPNEMPNAFLFSLRVLCGGLDARMDALAHALATDDKSATAEAEARVREVTDVLQECQRRLKDALDGRNHEGVVLLPGHYVKLYRGTERLVRGRITVDEWLPLLEAVALKVEAEQSRVAGQTNLIASQLDENQADALGYFNQLCDDSLRGLAIMRKWCDTRDVTDLNRGWTDLVAATVNIQKILNAMNNADGERDDRVILEDE